MVRIIALSCWVILTDNVRTFPDINECAEETDRCSQNCQNTVGSYTCSCNAGYRLDGDGFTCDDIHECAEMTHNCDQNCHNHIGSYNCSCNAGYRLNPDGFRCDGKKLRAKEMTKLRI